MGPGRFSRYDLIYYLNLISILSFYFLCFATVNRLTCISVTAVFLIVFTLTLFRTPKLDHYQADQDAEEDEEEGLLASTGRRFGATWQDITGKAKKKDGSSARRGNRDDPDADED